MNGNKKLTLYNGRVELGFDREEHCYTAAIDGKEAKPAGGVTNIIKETLGLDQRLANWMVKQAHDYIIDQISQYVQTAFLLDEMEAEFIRVPRPAFEKICKDAKSAHRKTSKDATDIGTQAHEYAEAKLKGECPELPSNPLAQKAAEAFVQWTETSHLEPLHIERMVFSEKWWYAGTCDYYGLVDGELCVLDLKTSSGFYREMPFQLAAYAVALEEETGEKIDHGWIVRLCKKTGQCEPHKFYLTQRLKDDWILIRGVHRALSRVEILIEEARDSYSHNPGRAPGKRDGSFLRQMKDEKYAQRG